jgi:hypothetical protein
MWIGLFTWSLAQDPLERHQAFVAEAMLAEREARPAAAIAACAEAIAALPQGPGAARCARRVGWLEARRDPDGTWSAWIALEAARRTPDREAARALVAALRAREQISDAVAAEAALWAADDALRRGAGAEAVGVLSGWYERRSGLEENAAEAVAQTYARALAMVGRVDEARVAEAEVRVATAAPRPTPVDAVVAAQRRADGEVAARAGLVGFAAAALARAAWLRGPAGPPWGALPIVAVAAAVWGLAEAWEHGAGRPVPGMTAALLAVHLLAWAGRAGHGAAGWALAAGAAIASGAVGWLWLG